MIINKLQYDPLQSFITSLAVHVKDDGGGGTGNTGDDDYTPMEGLLWLRNERRGREWANFHRLH